MFAQGRNPNILHMPGIGFPSAGLSWRMDALKSEVYIRFKVRNFGLDFEIIPNANRVRRRSANSLASRLPRACGLERPFLLHFH